MVLSALDTSTCSSSCLYCSMSKHDFFIWHLRNQATLEPKIANVPSSKVRLFAHYRHGSVESLFPPPITSSTCTRSTPWICPLFRRTNAHRSKAQLVNPCLISDVLRLSHHYFGAFTNPYTAVLNRRTVSSSSLSICLTSSGGEMKMFLISSSPLRNAVLMSPEIRRYLCEATHCMIKAYDAADNVGLSRGTSFRSGS